MLVYNACELSGECYKDFEHNFNKIYLKAQTLLQDFPYHLQNSCKKNAEQYLFLGLYKRYMPIFKNPLSFFACV